MGREMRSKEIDIEINSQTVFVRIQYFVDSSDYTEYIKTENEMDEFIKKIGELE